MKDPKRALRVAFIAGTLGHGGAERQMTHMIRALRISGVEVRVCCLTEGEHYEKLLQEEGVVVECVGKHSNPALRLMAIVKSLRRFKPHVLQAGQSFVNLHAALPARALGAISLGALRCDLELSSKDNGSWIRWLMRVPDAVVVNSQVVRNQLIDGGIVNASRVHYLANRVDLSYYDVTPIPHDRVNVLFVGRLVQSKRLDCYLHALAIARRSAPALAGLIVGDGPERASAELLAQELKLLPGHVRFAGFTDCLPDWLAQSDILLMCSESEGSANVLLEAMAARLPVVTTPAGDAEYTVKHNHTGFLVP
jgi:glycosyltransferase involved in cell wall biosynthesis